jgi:NAD(P)-dependent dehydrogenase (short-subunit alcohol dehydrogenase family)
MAERKLALVTGGTDRIRKATSKKPVVEGWEVVILGRNARSIDRHRRLIRAGEGQERE